MSHLLLVGLTHSCKQTLGNDCAVRPSVAIRLDTSQVGKRDSAKPRVVVVAVRIALLQTVPLLRFRRAVRMHLADSGTHLSQGRQERLHLLRIPHDHRKRYRANLLYSAGRRWLHASFWPPAPHRRPPGLRKPLQEVTAGTLNRGISPAAPNSSFSIPLPGVPRRPWEILYGQTRSSSPSPVPQAQTSQSNRCPGPSYPLARPARFVRL